MKRNVNILLLLLFCASSSLWAQEVKLTLSPKEILIGEQARIHLNLSIPVNDTVIWPDLATLLHEQLEVINQSKIDSSFNKANIRIRELSQEIIITSFDTGYYAIPSLPFVGTQETFYTEGLVLRVNTVPIDSNAQIADIYGPIQVPYTFLDFLKDYGWYPLVLAILVIACMKLLHWLKKDKHKKEEEAPVAIQEAHVIALQRLHQLKKERPWNVSVKSYYSDLSEIVRTYLEHRFKVLAMEQTTGEIMVSLSAQLSEDIAQDLNQILTDTDMVKFARMQPIAERHEPLLHMCIHFVEITQEKELREDGGNHIS